MEKSEERISTLTVMGAVKVEQRETGAGKALEETVVEIVQTYSMININFHIHAQ